MQTGQRLLFSFQLSGKILKLFLKTIQATFLSHSPICQVHTPEVHVAELPHSVLSSNTNCTVWYQLLRAEPKNDAGLISQRFSDGCRWLPTTIVFLTPYPQLITFRGWRCEIMYCCLKHTQTHTALFWQSLLWLRSQRSHLSSPTLGSHFVSNFRDSGGDCVRSLPLSFDVKVSLQPKWALAENCREL